jgi:hypothetical protein
MSSNKSATRLILGAILIAILGLLLSNGVFAGDAEEAKGNPCANAVVTSDEAKEIASDYMKDLGYNEHVGGSIWHFSLQEANCVNGQWRIHVDLGPHIALKDKAMVLVNCQTGEVEDHFSPEEELAVD